MTNNQIILDTEAALRTLAEDVTAIRPGECLLCYVWRMLEFGCRGLHWATRYRDERAPRDSALEERLGQRGGFCDCEIFVNGYEPAPQLWTAPMEVEEDGVEWLEDMHPPEEMPPCRGAARVSTKACNHWVVRR